MSCLKFSHFLWVWWIPSVCLPTSSIFSSTALASASHQWSVLLFSQYWLLFLGWSFFWFFNSIWTRRTWAQPSLFAAPFTTVCIFSIFGTRFLCSISGSSSPHSKVYHPNQFSSLRLRFRYNSTLWVVIFVLLRIWFDGCSTSLQLFSSTTRIYWCCWRATLHIFRQTQISFSSSRLNWSKRHSSLAYCTFSNTTLFNFYSALVSGSLF